jgi:hypothetical protein
MIGNATRSDDEPIRHDFGAIGAVTGAQHSPRFHCADGMTLKPPCVD